MASRSLIPQHQRQLDIPLFLAPAFVNFGVSPPSRKSFSTCSLRRSRQNRERNKQRGVSAIRSTGPRVPLKVSKYLLPIPVENSDRRKEFKTNDKHGLWGFFGEDRKAMISPEDEAAFGRPWTYQELSVKDWEDLYKLYWTCILEVNRSATRAQEMKRLNAGYGENESFDRMECIQSTLRHIRTVLRDRHVNYMEARHLLEGHEDAAELLADPENTEEDYGEAMEDDDPALPETDDQRQVHQAYPPDLVQHSTPTPTAPR